MPLVRLNKNSFVRRFENLGFIVNQMTRRDRVYDESGAIFLNSIGRAPQKMDEIIKKLSAEFVDADINIITTDFLNFCAELEAEEFTVSGETEQELNLKEPQFSYKTNPQTRIKTESGINHLNSAELLEKHFMRFPRLYSIQMEVVPDCNLRCVHCYLPFNNRGGVLPKSKYLDILDQLAEMGTIEVTFTGGEALLNEDLPELLLRGRKNDFSLGLLTNATLLTNEFVQVLKDVNIGLVQISVYSMNPNVHDKITGVAGSLRKTVAAVEKLVANQIRVQIGCPIMKENLDSFHEVLKWGEEMGVKVNPNVMIMARTNFSRENLIHRLNTKECGQAVRRIIKHDNNYRALLLSDNIPPAHDNPDAPVCGVGTSMMCLSTDGDYYPCPGFKMSLGNALRDSVCNVWTKSEKIKFLRSVKNSAFPKCVECAARTYCSVCMARNYNESAGNLFEIPEHFCKIAKENKKLAQDFRATAQATK